MTNNYSIKKVVMIGAGGNLGSLILPALRAAKIFQITVLVRPTSTSEFPSDVKVVRTDYSEQELVKVFKGNDAIICAIGATGFAEQKAFVDAAIKAGVRKYIPSELSGNTLSDAVRELVPVFEPKKQLIDYLKEKEATGLDWTGLAVGPLLDWGITTGFLGFDLKKQKAIIWDDGKTSFSATNQDDLAAAVVAILRHPSETANRFLYVQTAVVSHNEILQLLENKTRTKWTVERVTSEEQVAKGRKLVSQGDFSGMLMLVQAAAWSNLPGIRNNYARDEKLANAILGLKEGSLDETVAKLKL